MEISQVTIKSAGQYVSPALELSIRSGPVAMIMFILFNHRDGMSANIISACAAAAGDGCQTFVCSGMPVMCKKYRTCKMKTQIFTILAIFVGFEGAELFFPPEKEGTLPELIRCSRKQYNIIG